MSDSAAATAATTTATGITPRPVARGLMDAVGNTPLIRLGSLCDATGCEILGKAEWLNPGGSIKDRPAKFLLEKAEKEGRLRPGQHVLEASGGNTGIGLALACLAKGYAFTCISPETVSPNKIELLRTFGATVLLQPLVPYSNPDNYVRLAETMAAADPAKYYFVNQFENTYNSDAHYATTGPEIWTQTGGRVDAFVAAAGTGGTIAGVSTYLKERSEAVRVYSLDPPGSGILSYLQRGEWRASEGKSVTEGIGIMRRTANFARARVDGAMLIPDEETIAMAYHLLRADGIFVGPSAALNCVGAVKIARMLGPGKTVVTVLCDSGERYTNRKLFDRQWMAERNLLPSDDLFAAAEGRRPLHWIADIADPASLAVLSPLPEVRLPPS